MRQITGKPETGNLFCQHRVLHQDNACVTVNWGEYTDVPKAITLYVRYVDYISEKFGRMAMYSVIVMIAVMLLNAFTRNVLNIPLSWCVEMAQFLLAGYYIVGGAYSMQLDDHVRMDLLYSRYSDKTKARIDVFTSGFLIFYLCTLLFGSISSTIYAIETGQRKFSMWNPSMIPIKLIMVGGIILILLQAISMFFKDYAKATDRKLDVKPLNVGMSV